MGKIHHTCRFCKQMDYEVKGRTLFMYAKRHYICASCFLAKKWDFGRLTCWQLEQFPAMIAQEYGRYDELGECIKGWHVLLEAKKKLATV